MDQPVREQLAHFCYIAVLAVIGLVCVALAAGNRGNEVAGGVGLAGGWLLFIAVIYLVVTLIRLARALGQSDD